MLDALLTQIETALANSGHLVLLRARERIGECSYAANIAAYVKAKTRLEQWQRYDGSMLTPVPVWRGDDDYETTMRDRITALHREMYRQPCLICDACGNRRKLWQSKPYSHFGIGLTPKSQALLMISETVSVTTSSMPRSSVGPG